MQEVVPSAAIESLDSAANGSARSAKNPLREADLSLSHFGGRRNRATRGFEKSRGVKGTNPMRQSSIRPLRFRYRRRR